MTATDQRVATAEQAVLLLDVRLSGLLTLLGRAPGSAAALARALGQPVSTVHDQLRRLLVAGVVSEAGRRPRAGRPVREYRFASPWLIPFAVTPAATLRELLHGAYQAMLGAQLDALAHFMTRQDGEWAIQLTTGGGGMSHTFERPGFPHIHQNSQVAVMGSGAELRLRPARVLELRQRLKALFEEYDGAQDEGGEAWVLTVLLTPTEVGA